MNEYTTFPTLAPTVMILNVTVDTTTPKEKAREYGFLLLWGVFLLAVFVLATYIINHFLDRFCCCCVFEPEAMDQGIVSRKAQLFGLTLNERAKLLARIFPASVCWQAEELLATSTATLQVSEDPLTDVQHDRVCCICLLPYESGVQILKGTTCQHNFHYSCCMEWLKKHDECPYCRRELFTASELRAAAKQVLGESRVRAMGFPHLAHVDTTSNEVIPTGASVSPLPPEPEAVEEHAPGLAGTTESSSSDIESIGLAGESTPIRS